MYHSHDNNRENASFVIVFESNATFVLVLESKASFVFV